MQKVLSSDLWETVKAQAKKAHQRKAAVAYVTQDLLGLRKGDVLLMDASTLAISNGETDAKLLRTLHERGVQLYHCNRLHAKVILLDDVAVIGSGNLSKSSENDLVEAALMTDHTSTVAGVASFIEQLTQQSKKLKDTDIAKLCEIEVARRGGRQTGRKPEVSSLGNRTWLIGLHEVAYSMTKKEQELHEKAIEFLCEQTQATDDGFDHIDFGAKSYFAVNCQEGDSVIQIWLAKKAKQPVVIRTRPVLLKQPAEKRTWLYLRSEMAKSDEMTWGNFQKLLKEIGYQKEVRPGSIQLLDADIAEAIARKWPAFAKAQK